MVVLVIILKLVFKAVEDYHHPLKKLQREIESMAVKPKVLKVESRYYAGRCYVLNIPHAYEMLIPTNIDVDVLVRDYAMKLFRHLNGLDAHSEFEVRIDGIKHTDKIKSKEFFYFIENLYKEQQK